MKRVMINHCIVYVQLNCVMINHCIMYVQLNYVN